MAGVPKIMLQRLQTLGARILSQSDDAIRFVTKNGDEISMNWRKLGNRLTDEVSSWSKVTSDNTWETFRRELLTDDAGDLIGGHRSLFSRTLANIDDFFERRTTIEKNLGLTSFHSDAYRFGDVAESTSSLSGWVMNLKDNMKVFLTKMRSSNGELILDQQLLKTIKK